MRIAEHSTLFDPTIRIRDRKNLYVIVTPEEWAQIETVVGRHTNGAEIHELIMGVFTGKFKIVKR